MTLSRLLVALPPVALVLTWSSGFIGAELGTRQAPATTVLAWRYAIAASVLVAICLWRREHLERSTLGRQVVVGALSQVAYLGLVVAGVGLGASAGATSLIASMQPLVVIALAALFLSEPVRLRQLLGLGLGLIGVLLVVGGELTTGDASWWVYVLPLGGMAGLSIGTILQQQWLGSDSLLMSLTLQTVVGAAAFWCLAAARGTTAAPMTVEFWTAIAWVVLLASFGGYGSYLYMARTRGATSASTWLYLTPPTTMLAAAVMFGDRVSAAGLVGLAVSGLGVAVALRPRRQPSDLPRCTLSS